MAEINPESKFSLSLKEIVGAVVGLSSLFGIYFTLQASVDTNTEDIQSLKNNAVNPVEFQYKDELVRSTIQRVEEKTDVLSGDVKEVKDQLQKIDERLYQISKK
jgi:predicted RND superfamily exporter protein